MSTEDNLIRINKYLSARGVCSRREADRMINEGRVTVDGVTACPGTKVEEGQIILVDGEPVKAEDPPVLLKFYKPVGVVSSTVSQFGDTTVIDYIHYPYRVYPIGRLDKDSEGLLLLTNQGEIVNSILKASEYHEKEYIVTVDHDIDAEFIRRIKGGIPMLGTVTRKCRAEQTGRRTFRIILTQGLNRQIRRMCAYLGYSVVTLKRIRIMDYTLGSLKPGEYEEIPLNKPTGKEYTDERR